MEGEADNTNLGGAPTKYRPEMAVQAEKLCRLGATDKEMADFFDVHEDTIYEWKKAHSEFSESIKRGKLEADAEVADRLYQRALGYSHPSEKVFCQDGQVTRAPITEHYPPETAAAIFWLKNRQPAKWRDKQQVEQTVTHSVAPDAFENLEEAAKAYAESMKGK